MTATTQSIESVEIAARAAGREERRERLHMWLSKWGTYFNILGLGWVLPILRMTAGDDPKEQSKELWIGFGVPVLALLLFVLLWAQTAPRIETSLGEIPGPAQVAGEFGNLYADHVAQREKADAFYERQRKRNEAKLAENPHAEISRHPYTGKPTYFDQIFTSLQTVFMGFLFATLIAVPLGILCGLSKMVNAAFNPLIQVFKPVSPLAWLPLVTMVVSALYVSDDPLFQKSFLNSAITVTLCSLWPTLINTAVGVASIDRDLVNVGKVLQLSWFTTIRKLVLPSALPHIFTGLRVSLGVGWMVLIAAEMLAQNPGLGKFVWDEFQNGSSSSLAKIMVAVFTIGIIGFVLDRIMLTFQALTTYSDKR